MVYFSAPPNDIKQTLIHRNSNYELWEDMGDNLQYVRLSEHGTKKIVEKYEKQYGLKNKIEVIAIDTPELKTHYICSQTAPAINKKIVGIINSKKDAIEDSKGFIFVVKNKDGYVAHSIPITVARNQNNDFTIKSSDHIRGIDMDKSETDKYYSWQKDFHSCTVFAVNWLKHKLLDNSDNLHFYQSVNKAKDHIKPQYIDESFNRKSIFKGHDYATILQSEHKDLLNDKTKTLLNNIDTQRGKKRPVLDNDAHNNHHSTENKPQQNSLSLSPTTNASLLLTTVFTIGGIISAIFTAPLIATISLFATSLIFLIGSSLSYHNDMSQNQKDSPPLKDPLLEKTSPTTEKQWQTKHPKKTGELGYAETEKLKANYISQSITRN